MEYVVLIVAVVLWCLVVGLFARLALPGKDPMSIWATIGLGLVGSLVAVLVTLVLFGQIGGFLLCLAFAVAILYVIRRRRGGGLVDPGAPPARR
jgi:uncharacterized membrane protein YeaQ/YmgE (transglycosylase-associated protein family)